MRMILSLILVASAAIGLTVFGPRYVLTPLGLAVGPKPMTKADFVESEFNIYRYSRAELGLLFKEIVPPGTSKDYVDAVLTKNNSVRLAAHEHDWLEGLCRRQAYYEPPNLLRKRKGSRYRHDFIFDSASRLVDILVAGDDWVHSDKGTPENPPCYPKIETTVRF